MKKDHQPKLIPRRSQRLKRKLEDPRATLPQSHFAPPSPVTHGNVPGSATKHAPKNQRADSDNVSKRQLKRLAFVRQSCSDAPHCSSGNALEHVSKNVPKARGFRDVTDSKRKLEGPAFLRKSRSAVSHGSSGNVPGKLSDNVLKARGLGDVTDLKQKLEGPTSPRKSRSAVTHGSSGNGEGFFACPKRCRLDEIGNKDDRWGNVPNELVKKILSRLSLLDVVKCRRVNSRFRDVLTDTAFENIDLTNFPYGHFNKSRLDGLLGFLRCVGPGMRSFAMGASLDEISTLDILPVLDQHCLKLKTLSVSNVYVGNWLEQLDRLRLWERLTTIVCHSFPMHGLAITTGLKRLNGNLVLATTDPTTVQMERMFNLDFIQSMIFESMLKIVRYAHEHGLGDRVMRGAIGGATVGVATCYELREYGQWLDAMRVMFPTLHKIHASFWQLGNHISQSLVSLTPFLHQFVSLSLSASRLSDGHVNEPVFEGMLHLKSLTISHCSFDRNPGFLSKIPDLDELVVANCSKTAVLSVFRFLTPAAALTKLVVKWENYSPPVDFVCLAQCFRDRQFPLLRKLQISKCHKFGKNQQNRLNAIFRSSPGIEHLELEGAFLGDWVFGSVLLLQSLRLADLRCDRFTLQGMLEFARSRRRRQIGAVSGSGPGGFPRMELKLPSATFLCGPGDREEMGRAEIIYEDPMSIER